MQLKIFAIDAHGGDEASEEMNRFLRSHRLAAVSRRGCPCVASEPRQSQRDCVTKPGVGTACLPRVDLRVMSRLIDSGDRVKVRGSKAGEGRRVKGFG